MVTVDCSRCQPYGCEQGDISTRKEEVDALEPGILSVLLLFSSAKVVRSAKEKYVNNIINIYRGKMRLDICKKFMGALHGWTRQTKGRSASLSKVK